MPTQKIEQFAFSDSSKRLAAPGTDVWRVHYDALARQQAGEDVLLLSVGDPDFDTPAEISGFVKAQIDAGRTHYSPAAGEPHLRQTIATMESNNTGNNINPEQVAIFPGATAALYCALSTMMNAGEGIVVPEPMYVGYHSMFTAMGLDVQTVPLAAPEFALNLDQLANRIDANTKAVLVNTPGNPLGNMIGAEQLIALAELCKARGVWLICDEVYSLITFSQRHQSLLNCVADYQHLVVIDGLSKSHAMSGWRLGWAIGDQGLIEGMVRFSGATLFGVSQFVQDAASFALSNDAAAVELMRQAYQRRCDYAVNRIRDLGLRCFRPQAGMFVMLDAGSWPQAMLHNENLTRERTNATTNAATNNDLGLALAELLLEKAGISTIPGSAFGPSASHYVRMSLTLERQGLADAFQRIERLLQGQ